jgi:hypothetical protein
VTLSFHTSCFYIAVHTSEEMDVTMLGIFLVESLCVIIAHRKLLKKFLPCQQAQFFRQE